MNITISVDQDEIRDALLKYLAEHGWDVSPRQVSFSYDPGGQYEPGKGVTAQVSVKVQDRSS